MVGYSSLSQQIILYVGIVVFIMGLIGSVMQIFIFTIVPIYRKNPCTFYFFIASLHEFGLFVASYAPQIFSYSFSTSLIDLYRAWCKIRHIFTCSCAIVPLTLTCLATVDQYLVTCQSVQRRSWSNLKSAYIASAFFIVVWWLHGTLWIYFQDISAIIKKCVFTNVVFQIYGVIFILFIMIGLHIVIMIIFAILIHKNIRNTTVLARQNVDQQIIKMIRIQIGFICFSLVPWVVNTAYSAATARFPKSNDRIAIESMLTTVTYIVGGFAFGCRFYIFLYTSQKFRQQVKQQIDCSRRHGRVRPF